MTHEFASLLKDISTLPVSCKLLGLLFGVNCEFLERQYRNYLIGYMNWNDKQGEKRMFGKHHRNHKRYGCQDCHIRPVKAFQAQTLSGLGNNP